MSNIIKSKPANQLFEEGFVTITLAAYKLRKEGKYQEAYYALRDIVDMLSADRDEVRKLAEI